MLYKDWLEDWLTNYVMPSSKDKTYSRYADIVNQHLIPKLGEYTLYDLYANRRIIYTKKGTSNLRTARSIA